MTLQHITDKGKRGNYPRVTITKQEATQTFLTGEMPQQRPPRINDVQEHTVNINGGTFLYIPGQAVHYDTNGKLRNGQHRFLGLALANDNAYIEVDVCTGCTEDEILSLDLGNERNMKDLTAFKNPVSAQESQYIASIGRAALLFDVTQGNLAAAVAGTGSTIITKSEEYRYINETNYAEISAAAKFVARPRTSKKLLAPRIEGLLYLLFSRINVEMAKSFFLQLNSGTELGANTPMWVLHNRLTAANSTTKKKTEKVTPRESAFYTVKTWNAIRAKDTIQRLKVHKGEEIVIDGLPVFEEVERTKISYSGSNTTKQIRTLLGFEKKKGSAA